MLVIDQSEYIEDRPVPGPFPAFPMTKREKPWERGCENTITAIFCRLVCFISPCLANNIQLLHFYIMANGLRRFQPSFGKFWSSAVYFIFDIVSFDITSICRHFNGSPILCPINATSSSSYVFRLQYPRVLHCRIVLKEKLKKLLALGRKKPPTTNSG